MSSANNPLPRRSAEKDIDDPKADPPYTWNARRGGGHLCSKVFSQVSVIVVGGRQVSISHLAPTIFSCPSAAFGRDILIQLEFSNHCYTCGFDAALHSPADVLLHDPKRRVFDPVRHKLSLGLPGMLAQLPTSKVHRSAAKRNFVYSTLVSPPAVRLGAYALVVDDAVL